MRNVYSKQFRDTPGRCMQKNIYTFILPRNVETLIKLKLVLVLLKFMNQKAQEAEKVDLCHDGCELFRIAKQKVGEKRKLFLGLVVLKIEFGQ